jgi:hypothetical protein
MIAPPTKLSDTATAALAAIDGTSSRDVWAVGTRLVLAGINNPLILHWDGEAWQYSLAARPETQRAYLGDVTALSPRDAWAVGSARSTEEAPAAPMAQHWDGSDGRWLPFPLSRCTAP